MSEPSTASKIFMEHSLRRDDTSEYAELMRTDISIFLRADRLCTPCEIRPSHHAQNRSEQKAVDCFLDKDLLSPIIPADARMKRLCICIENNDRRTNHKGTFIMATAKKAAPKAATKPVKTAPAKAVKVVAKPAAKAAPKAAAKPAAKPVAAKPVAKKAVVSKTAKAIAKISASLAKLNDRKAKISAEIAALKDQRAALKAAPAAPAVAAAPAKAVKKAAKAK
jgi:hypothetical protein